MAQSSEPGATVGFLVEVEVGVEEEVVSATVVVTATVTRGVVFTGVVGARVLVPDVVTSDPDPATVVVTATVTKGVEGVRVPVPDPDPESIANAVVPIVYIRKGWKNATIKSRVYIFKKEHDYYGRTCKLLLTF